MSNADVRGRFVWHELMTTDSAGAGAFYSRVISWKAQPWEQDASYTLWMSAAGPAGGVMALPPEGGAGPFWLPYIGTPDVAGAVNHARSLGASVVRDTTELPNVGKFAVLKDPQGATFAVYTPRPGQSSEPVDPRVGEFSWHELSTTDYGAALRFYVELFGWDKGPAHDMGGGMTYQMFHHGGKEIGGMFNAGQMGDPSPPHWLCYVRVDDAGKAANAAKSAGGRVVNGPMEVPGGDWIAQIIDPQGAAFAVHEKKRAAKAAAPAQPKPAQAKKVAAATAPAAAAPAAVSQPAAKPAATKPAAVKPAAAKPAARKKAVKKAKKAVAKKGKAKRKAARRKAPAKRRPARVKRAAPKQGRKSTRARKHR